MDNITKKKINECVKRTLIYNSGKKIKRPVNFCSIQDTLLDNRCQSNVNPESAPGEDSAANERGLNLDCYGCPFMKSYIYASDALLGLKTRMALSYNDGGMPAPSGYAPARASSCAMQFLMNLLSLVRERCYLTFTNSMLNDAQNQVQCLNYTDLYQLISNIYEFCKENNIK